MPRLPFLGPDSPPVQWLTRVTREHLTPRGARFTAYIAAMFIAFGFIGLLAFVQVSSTPKFCGTCHIMQPYYKSWQHSSHNRIACVECHISPGVTAEIRKKWEAMSMVAKYLTHTYSQHPWAEVEDAACLRCHERRLLEGRVQFHDVTFDHTPHLTETRRGIRLRCTSCHSQIVQGMHIAVTSSTCALCHFQGQQPNQGLARCTRCHEVPDRVVGNATASFDHRQVSAMGMDCRSCHGGVVRGDGNVPKERCVTCHNQPERIAQFDKPDLLHRKHVTEHKVDCQNCHLLIEHGQPAPEAATAAAETGNAGTCGACHGSGHSPQQLLYQGRGERGVKDLPGPMYLAGVTCEGCHNASLDARTQEAGALAAHAPAGGRTFAAATASGGVTVAAAAPPGIHTAHADEVSCMSCHGARYGEIFRAWKSEVDARTAAMGRLLEASDGAMGIDPPRAYEDALANWRLVSRGRGVHNPNYAYAVLDAAYDQLNSARKARGLGPVARPWRSIAAASAACLSCHAGIEKQSGTFGGLAYSHGPHLLRANLECATCHRPHAERAPGEVVRFGAADCAPCHHRATPGSNLVCARCHGDIRSRTVQSFRGEFSHKAHLEQGLDCTTCHDTKSGDPRPQKAACEQCHVG